LGAIDKDVSVGFLAGGIVNFDSTDLRNGWSPDSAVPPLEIGPLFHRSGDQVLFISTRSSVPRGIRGR
jgi:hypothetical protein